MSGQEWRLRVACAAADPRVMFATGPEVVRFIADFCVGCPVRAECRAADPDGDELGVYGGLTQAQRQSQSRRRRPNPKLRPHGTEAAYQRHVRHREAACGPCRDGHDRHLAGKVRRVKPPVEKRVSTEPAGPRSGPEMLLHAISCQTAFGALTRVQRAALIAAEIRFWNLPDDHPERVRARAERREVKSDG